MGEKGEARNLGLEVLEFIFENMGINEEWSIREQRCFTWWGHHLAQRVWVEPVGIDEGFDILRVHARTDLLRNVPTNLETARRLAALNKFASMNSLVWEPAGATVRLHCSAYIYAETTEWLSRVFLAATAIQVADAHVKVKKTAQLLGAIPDTSAHPTSGARPDMDEMLNVIQDTFAPQGQGASPFTESDFSAAIRMAPKIWISPRAEGQTLQAILWDRPAESSTALLFASAKDRHPQLGSGVLLRMSVPLNLETDATYLLSLELNRMELNELARCHFLGSWCADNNPELGLTFLTFLPAASYRKGLLEAMCLNMGARALWARKRLAEFLPRVDRLMEQLGG